MLRRSLTILLFLLLVLPMLAHKRDSIAARKDSVVTYLKFVKTQTSLCDFDMLDRRRKFFKNKEWLNKLMTEAGISDSMSIPVMMNQRVVRITRNVTRNREKHDVLAINREGLDEMFNLADALNVYVSGKLKGNACKDTLMRMRKLGSIGHFQVRRTESYFDIDPDSVPTSSVKHRIRYSYDGMSDYRQFPYWAKYDSTLYKALKEQYTQDSLNSYSLSYDSTKVAKHSQTAVQQDAGAVLEYFSMKHRWLTPLTFTAISFINNYIELGKKPVFSIEPVSSIFSVNTEDGFRLRFGGKTTANLFRRNFLSGYVAYGFGSQRVYGMGNAIYSFVDKVYDPNEYPIRSISIVYRNDICPLGERNNHTDHDNLFQSYQWNRNSRMMFFNLQKVEFEWDCRNGIGYLVGIKREEDTATPGDKMKFHSLYDIEVDKKSRELGQGTIFENNGSLCTTELRFELKYVPPTKRFATRKSKAPVNNELPTMELMHNVGVRMWGGKYSFQLSELRIFKDWYLGKLGVGRTTLRAGHLWSTVPFPLLLSPSANVSYISDDNTFGMLRMSEFLNDRYIQVNMSIETNGNLIGLIPLIKRLRWKEYAGVRVLWGALSDKNNPELKENENSTILMKFPTGCYIMNGNEPYVEGVVGIHNIFHVINLDYVFRFTYRNLPDSGTGGFRFSVHF